MYKRAEFQIIKDRLEEPRKFIQVVMGARQIGKSTVVKQVLKDLDLPYLFYSADNIPASNTAWVSDCWEAVRSLKRSNNWESAILVIDEIQKVSNWSEVVKKEWDDDMETILSVRHLSTASMCSIGASAKKRWISYFARRIHVDGPGEVILSTGNY